MSLYLQHKLWDLAIGLGVAAVAGVGVLILWYRERKGKPHE